MKLTAKKPIYKKNNNKSNLVETRNINNKVTKLKTICKKWGWHLWLKKPQPCCDLSSSLKFLNSREVDDSFEFSPWVGVS